VPTGEPSPLPSPSSGIAAARLTPTG
jgi:hypothetical protein